MLIRCLIQSLYVMRLLWARHGFFEKIKNYFLLLLGGAAMPIYSTTSTYDPKKRILELKSVCYGNTPPEKLELVNAIFLFACTDVVATLDSVSRIVVKREEFILLEAHLHQANLIILVVIIFSQIHIMNSNNQNNSGLSNVSVVHFYPYPYPTQYMKH